MFGTKTDIHQLVHILVYNRDLISSLTHKAFLARPLWIHLCKLCTAYQTNKNCLNLKSKNVYFYSTIFFSELHKWEALFLSTSNSKYSYHFLNFISLYIKIYIKHNIGLIFMEVLATTDSPLYISSSRWQSQPPAELPRYRLIH